MCVYMYVCKSICNENCFVADDVIYVCVCMHVCISMSEDRNSFVTDEVKLMLSFCSFQDEEEESDSESGQLSEDVSDDDGLEPRHIAY